MTKSVFAVLGAVVIGLAIVGGYFYPKFAAVGGSSAGTTFNTAKFAGAVASLASAGANGTTTSILNTDAFDRIVLDVEAGCEGVGSSKTAYTGTGLANLFVTVGTTSTAAPAAFPSGFNVVGGVNYNISTSTPNTLLASSTAGVSTTSIIWSAGSYLTYFTNATNTAACTFGSRYMGS